MKTRKVVVYEYVGEYGDGLVFVDIKSEENQYYEKSPDYEKIGVFDLPIDFLEAIGLNKDNQIAYYAYIE